MKRLQWKNLIGQRRVAEVLAAAHARGSLGHAYLFCGGEGVGTLQAALELAMGLLCEHQHTAPCYMCASCTRARHNAHQDLHVVVPVELTKEHRGSSESVNEEGWKYIGGVVQDRIACPYRLPGFSGVPTIPLDWIHELNHAILRGPVLGGAGVAILCAPELLRRESMNAMLKTLEEPPAGMTIILCSESAQSLLPTVQSRCQLLRFGRMSDAEVTEGLQRLHPDPLAPEQVAAIVASAEGSLGAALALAADPHPEAARAAERLWDIIGEPDELACANGIDGLSADLDAGSCERMLGCWARLAHARMLGAPGVTPSQTELLLRVCQRAVRASRARAVLPLLLAGLVYESREILHV